MLVGGDLDFRFFELVDIGVNGIKRSVVSGAVVFSACFCRYFAKEGFVDIAFHSLHLRTIGCWDRYLYLSTRANADRVYSCFIPFSDLKGIKGAYKSNVIDTVGEQNDDLAFCICAPETVDAGGESHTNSCAICEHAALNFRNLFFDDAMIYSDGTLCEAFAAEDNDTNAVGGAAVDEIDSYFFGCLDAVGFKILSHHRSRDVDGHDDINALGVDVFADMTVLWASEGYYEERQGKVAKDREDGTPTHPDALRSISYANDGR